MFVESAEKFQRTEDARAYLMQLRTKRAIFADKYHALTGEKLTVGR